MIRLHSYDFYVIYFSGGKDSMAAFLYLLAMGVPKEKIELWHHSIDGSINNDFTFMDWECTTDYCRAFAKAIGVPIYFSWKEGGFYREMNRKDQPTAPTTFEMPDAEGYVVRKTIGGNGQPRTRGKFPQVSGDLRVRWCSAYLKIDVGAAAVRNQRRFFGKRVLTISGERGEESVARSKYFQFEIDRSDARGGRVDRHVDRFRPILHWKEKAVWDIIVRNRIIVHPAYWIGFSRVSCKYCIFGNADQFVTAAMVSPIEQTQRMINQEFQSGLTIKRNKSLVQLMEEGKPYKALSDNNKMAHASISEYYNIPIILEETEGMSVDLVPPGAYGHSCGPT